MAHLGVSIVSVPELLSRLLAPLVGGAACYRYWLCKELCWLALSGICSKNNVSAVSCEFRRWGPDVEAIGWPKQIDLIVWHLLVRTASNKEFEYSQPKAFLFHPHFSEENEKVHLQPHLPCPSNTQSENDTWRALAPNKPAWSSDSLYLWSDVDCCDWWARELCACKLLGSAAIF